MNILVSVPIVSVYIPSYKAEETLEKAVRSALSQMENLEVIIVDDCSPDNSFTVAQKLAQEDSRVRVFRLEKNSGASFAMNYAFNQARGKWLALLDSDDWYEPGRLIRLLNEAVAENVEMAADNQYFFDKHANRRVGTAFLQKGDKSLIDLDSFLANSNATECFDYGMLKPMFRADFIKEHAIKYHINTSISYDYYILLDFFVAGGKAVLLDEPLYNYVQPFGSISGKPQQEGRKPYNHEMQKATHDYFMEKLKDKISVKQLYNLKRRGREIDSLIAFYKLREALKNKDIKASVLITLKTPPEFWKMIAGKLVKYLRRKLKV